MGAVRDGIVSSEKVLKSELLILRMLIFGNRIFANIIKMSLSGWDPTPIGLMSL